MKKLILLFVVTNIIGIKGAFTQSSVWKISNDKKTLYIGGSIHLLKKSDYPLPIEFDTAYERAETIIFEADIKSLKTPQVLEKIQKKSIYTDGRTLQNVLSPEVYQELEEACTEYKIPFSKMQVIKPGLIIMILTALQYESLGFTHDGVDLHYFEKTYQDHKEREFLETIDFQIELITNMGAGDENSFVDYSLEDMENTEESLSEIVTEWRTGETKSIVKMMKEIEKEYPALFNSLFVMRNKSWVSKIEKYLESEKVEFIIVGNAHLPGKNGVLSMLKSKDYTVEQMTITEK